MGKRKKRKRTRYVAPDDSAAQQIAINVKWITPDGQSHHDFQVVTVPKSASPGQVMQDVVDHLRSHHPENRYSVTFSMIETDL